MTRTNLAACTGEGEQHETKAPHLRWLVARLAIRNDCAICLYVLGRGYDVSSSSTDTRH
jgi:hypothetical protein